jgi:tetratricopeptide (TPR) repeat protein
MRNELDFGRIRAGIKRPSFQIAAPIPHAAFFTPLLRVALVVALVGSIVWAVRTAESRLAAQQGAQLLTVEQYNAAQTELEAALAGGNLGDLDGSVRLHLSATYLARHDGARAAAVLAPVLKSTDALLLGRAWVQQGRVAAWTSQTAAAVAAWQTALRVLPTTRNQAAQARRAAQWHMAETAWQTGAPDAAAQFATLAAAPAPSNDPYTVSAVLRLAQIRNAGAERPDPVLVTAARLAGPPDPSATDVPFLNLPGQDEGLPPATWTSQLAGLESAVAEALGQPALSPASRAAFWGRAWVQAGEWPVAARTLAVAVAANPTLADAYAYLGLAQQRLGQNSAALSALLTALRLAPDRPLERHLLARFYLAIGDVPHAQTHLDWLRSHNADLLVTTLDQAQADQLRGDVVATEQDYLTAEQLSGTGTLPGVDSDLPLNPALLLAAFYEGYAPWSCDRGQPAAQQALDRHAGANEYDALGWADHLCQNNAAALAPLQQASRLAPRDPRIYYHLGVVLKALEQGPSARAAFIRASDYDPNGPWERRALTALATP